MLWRGAKSKLDADMIRKYVKHQENKEGVVEQGASFNK